MSEQWFVRLQDEVVGPIPTEKLDQLVRRNQANARTQVRPASGGPWVPLGQAFQPKRTARPPALAPASPPAPVWPRRRPAGMAWMVAAVAMTVVASVVLLKINKTPTIVAQAPLTAPAPPMAEAASSPDGPVSSDPSPPASSPPVAATTEPPKPVLPPNDPDATPIDVTFAEDPEAILPDLPVAIESAPEGNAPPLDALEQGQLPEPAADAEPATDLQIARFLDQLNRERDPAAGVERFKKFFGQYRLSPAHRTRLSVEFQKWKQRAAQGQVRLGPRWVSPAEEQAAEKAGLELLKQSSILLDLGDYEQAYETLERASVADPNAIEADHLLGVIHSVLLVEPRKAQQRFAEVLKRYPDHLSALNNLAVSEIKLRDYKRAIQHLTRCSELAPRCQEVAQNLGRLSWLASRKVVVVPEQEKRSCNDLYTSLIANGRASACDTQSGWALMPLLLPDAQRESGIAASTAGEMTLLGFGTGFAIQPDLVLTNRHVVTDEDNGLGKADELRILSGKRELTGHVVAVDDLADLALVRFPDLAARPLSLRTESARVGEEVAILGYPTPMEIGSDLKFVRGDVASAKNDEVLLSAVANQGNSGGPIVALGGDVVGVYTFVLKTGTAVRTQFGGGVSLDHALRFVRQHVPDYASPDSTAPTDWPGTVDQLRPSVYKLDVYYRSSSLAFMSRPSRYHAKKSYLEDRTCPVCSGRTGLACPFRRCNKGSVKIFWTEKQPQQQLNGSVVIIDVPYERVDPCGVCDGVGFVDCPYCQEGIDSQLK